MHVLWARWRFFQRSPTWRHRNVQLEAVCISDEVELHVEPFVTRLIMRLHSVAEVFPAVRQCSCITHILKERCVQTHTSDVIPSDVIHSDVSHSDVIHVLLGLIQKCSE